MINTVCKIISSTLFSVSECHDRKKVTTVNKYKIKYVTRTSQAIVKKIQLLILPITSSLTMANLFKSLGLFTATTTTSETTNQTNFLPKNSK